VKNISIKVKLLGAFAIILVAVAALGIFSVWKLGTIDSVANTLADEWLPGVEVAKDFQVEVARIRIRQAMHVMATTDEQAAGFEKEISEFTAKLHDGFKAYEGLIDSPEEKEAFQRFRSIQQPYEDLGADLLKLSQTKQKEQATALYMGKMREIQNQVIKSVDELVKFNTDGAEMAKRGAGAAPIAGHQVAVPKAGFGGGSGISVAGISFVRDWLAGIGWRRIGWRSGFGATCGYGADQDERENQNQIPHRKIIIGCGKWKMNCRWFTADYGATLYECTVRPIRMVETGEYLRNDADKFETKVIPAHAKLKRRTIRRIVKQRE
jgi:hypothetical protein